MGLRFLGLWLTALMAVACVQAPDVPDPGSANVNETVHPDVLLNYTIRGTFGVCRPELPECEEPLGSPCLPADHMPPPLDLLGPPDGVSFTMDKDGRVDVGFHCGAITEAGPLIIHATATSMADVYVSQDGISYTMIGVLPDGDADADAGVDGDSDYILSEFDVHSARYVRIFDVGGGGTAIDSIEGTWNGVPY